MCVDFTETNPVRDQQLKTFFTTLPSGQSFSELDLSHAYHQQKQSEEALAYTVINTHNNLLFIRDYILAFTTLEFSSELWKMY